VNNLHIVCWFILPPLLLGVWCVAIAIVFADRDEPGDAQ